MGTQPELTCAEALAVLLDQCDYTYGACSVTETVGDVIPVSVLQQARAALAKARGEKT